MRPRADASTVRPRRVAGSSRVRRAGLVVALAIASSPATAFAQGQGARPDDLLSRPIALVLALALVAILPLAFTTVTAFVKISTVLQIVKGAIGAQSVPSNTVVLALSAALTVVAMAPVTSRVVDKAAPLFAPGAALETSALAVGIVDATREPLRDFLAANASEHERTRFLELSRANRPAAERELVTPSDFVVLVPSFVITELSEAFALGFALYLPFLVIDLVVSNVLLALGMQMMNPTQVSLPFKLLLFVAIDGWGLLAQTLVTGYRASP